MSHIFLDFIISRVIPRRCWLHRWRICWAGNRWCRSCPTPAERFHYVLRFYIGKFRHPEPPLFEDPFFITGENTCGSWWMLLNEYHGAFFNLYSRFHFLKFLLLLLLPFSHEGIQIILYTYLNKNQIRTYM